jgi:acid stress-induced BolA-like protein IbaG/YrbA
LDVSPGRTAQKKRTKYEQQKVTCSKLSAVVATADFQQKKTKEKDLGIPEWNLKREALAKISLIKAKERATSAYSCRRVSVQGYSVQYKGYNLVGVTTVEEGTTKVRQHWFIYSYISAYIQALYMDCPGLLEYIC